MSMYLEAKIPKPIVVSVNVVRADRNSKSGVNGLFKVNLELPLSGLTWKMKYQCVLETGN